MKKLFGFLALAGLVGASIVMLRNKSEAMPPPPLPAVQLECIGSNGCCGSTGPREYAYRAVLPGGTAPSVTRIDIGTHWPNIGDLTNFLMPAGWTANIIPAPYTAPDKFACDAHGTIVTATGTCPYILRFSTTTNPQTSTFTVGFDTLRSFDAHDVSWKASTGNQSNWTYPLGLGRGPVHCIAVP